MSAWDFDVCTENFQDQCAGFSVLLWLYFLHSVDLYVPELIHSKKLFNIYDVIVLLCWQCLQVIFLTRSLVSSAQSYSAKNKVHLLGRACTYYTVRHPHVNIYLWRKCEAVVVPVAVLQADKS